MCLFASFCIQPRTTIWKKPRARTLEVHIDFRWRDQLPDQVAKFCQSDGIDWSQCNAVQWRKHCHIFAILYTPNVSCYIFCNGTSGTGYHWINWDVLSHAVPQDFASNSPLGAMLNFPSSKKKTSLPKDLRSLSSSHKAKTFQSKIRKHNQIETKEHDNLHNCKSVPRKSMIVGYDANIIHELDLQWFAMNRQTLKLYSTVPGLIPLFRIWFLCHVSIAKLQRHIPSLPISASI